MSTEPMIEATGGASILPGKEIIKGKKKTWHSQMCFLLT